MRPLTPELLRARTVAMFTKVADENGPIEDVIFEVVYCDGCRFTLNLLRDGYPIGWVTEGDLASGFTDLCPECQ
jgi:hypothetical protein